MARLGGLGSPGGLGKSPISGGGYNYQSAGAIAIGGFSRHRASFMYTDSI
jgi:hypothetical protein